MKQTKPETPSDWNYEAAIAEIEDIIAQLESGELPLETVFAQFEVAVAQLKQCDRFLNQGQERLDLLIETLTDDDG
ncbi:MAG: exodeoxyribonuclease VII small subunit [Spirulina sp. SIO3F2]|nr:exodeoxyribonuclease VII small subunit [Spirulina sp. SIO3F2]